MGVEGGGGGVSKVYWKGGCIDNVSFSYKARNKSIVRLGISQ